MQTLVLPLRIDSPWYSFIITLSEVVFTLTFRYNSRMDRWIMDIADASGNDILAGIPLLILRDLTGQYVIDGLPPGTFYVVDSTNQNTQPSRDSWGVTHSLRYVDPVA